MRRDLLYQLESAVYVCYLVCDCVCVCDCDIVSVYVCACMCQYQRKGVVEMHDCHRQLAKPSLTMMTPCGERADGL